MIYLSKRTSNTKIVPNKISEGYVCESGKLRRIYSLKQYYLSYDNYHGVDWKTAGNTFFYSDLGLYIDRDYVEFGETGGSILFPFQSLHTDLAIEFSNHSGKTSGGIHVNIAGKNISTIDQDYSVFGIGDIGTIHIEIPSNPQITHMKISALMGSRIGVHSIYSK